jgi:hypothetical protein
MFYLWPIGRVDSRASQFVVHGEDARVGRVVFEISMSLDGFVASANARPEEPLGDGGRRLGASGPVRDSA